MIKTNITMNATDKPISEMKTTIDLTFTESDRNSGKVISKLDSGKICLVSYNSKNGRMVKPGETWKCKIVSEDDRKAIIDPIELTLTVEQNAMLISEKLSELKHKFQN